MSREPKVRQRVATSIAANVGDPSLFTTQNSVGNAALSVLTFDPSFCESCVSVAKDLARMT